MRPDPPNLIDRSLKVLIRRVPPAFFRLLRVEVDPAAIRPGDVSVNLPEHRADQLFLVGDEADPERWGLHLEYQLQPDARVLRGWLLKNAALSAQLDIPIILTVVYLAKGDRATFPSSYTASGGGLKNEFLFHTIRLWEHADRIRSGEVPELAPLLVLCEDNPTVETLREEAQLIMDRDTPEAVRADLLAVAVTVGTRFFARDVLERVFKEEWDMIKEASFIQEWIEEGEARGQVRGEARGEAREARSFLLRQLRKLFGELPEAVVERVESADREWCEEIGERLLDVHSLEELGLDGAGNTSDTETESTP